MSVVGFDGSDFKDLEEGKRPRTDFGERYDVLPVAVCKFEASYLLNGKQRHSANGSVATDDYVYRGSFGAIEESFHVGLALSDEQFGPYCAVLEEGFAPVTTHRSGVETILLGNKVGGDEGEDFQRDAIDANEGVLPFANSCQRGRGILVESRNCIRGEAVGK